MKKRPMKRFGATIGPVDPDEFRFALSLATAAHDGKMSTENPSRKQLDLMDDNSGTVSTITLTDIPFNRAVIAIRDHYGPDAETFQAIVMRLFGLMDIMETEPARKWSVHPSNEQVVMRIHYAVLDAAAKLPLDRNLKFNHAAFWNHVEDLAQSKYTDHLQ